MRAVLLLSLGACSFSARGRPQDAGIDVPIDIVDSPPDASTYCLDDVDTMVACYELAGSTMDLGPHHLDPVATSVTYVPGPGGGGMAAHFDATTQVNVPENPALDPAQITIEAWIHAPWPASGARAGIVDNQGQWGMFLHEEGELQCIAGGNVEVNWPDNAWTHVACTYDGTSRKLYVDGQLMDTVAGSGPLTAGGTTGISIGADNPPGAGSPLLGDMYGLRIYSVARDATQICRDAQCVSSRQP